MTPASAHPGTAPTASKSRRRGACASALVLLALLLTALAPVTADAAKNVPKGFFGLSEGGSFGPKDYQRMHKAKVETYRLTLVWRAAEPQRGVFHWSSLDARVGALAQNGISPVVMVWGSPRWVTGSDNPGVPPRNSKELRAWSSFLTAAVNRYKSGGQYWKANPDVPVKPVESWQIWNEPNLPKYFAKDSGGAKSVPKPAKVYAKLVKSSDKAMHKADKRAKVILAGLSSKAKKKKLEPNAFIEKFLKAKKITKRFSAAALHPYAPKISKYESRISKFRKAMDKNGARKKPIWLTEVGWGSKHGHGSLNKGKSGQAKLLKKSFKVTLAKRHKWKIDRMLWFDWRDPPQGHPVGCSFCPSAGLLKNNGKTKPSYRQFKHFTKLQGKGGHHGHHH
jgi:hypothetical protein